MEVEMDGIPFGAIAGILGLIYIAFQVVDITTRNRYDILTPVRIALNIAVIVFQLFATSYIAAVIWVLLLFLHLSTIGDRAERRSARKPVLMDGLNYRYCQTCESKVEPIEGKCPFCQNRLG
jgi:hypothetical protein